MYINHFAIWVDDLELMRSFYCTYFGCESNAMYHNPIKQFTSYFLSFKGSACRIEIMTSPHIVEPSKRNFMKGMAHFDITVGDEQEVDRIVALLRKDGFRIFSEPRKTGDGYYEAGILDPEGNLVDLSAKRWDI